MDIIAITSVTSINIIPLIFQILFLGLSWFVGKLLAMSVLRRELIIGFAMTIVLIAIYKLYNQIPSVFNY